MLEILLVVLLLLAFLLVAYKGAIHEFQILQKDWAPNMDWGSLLSEQLPLVIRNVDPSWQGWNRKVQQKPWPIEVEGARKGRWNEWLSSPPGQPTITLSSLDELSAMNRPPIELWEDGGFRRMTWLPAHLARPRVHVLGPNAIQPVRNTMASTTLIQATDGSPLLVWLAHEGAVPSNIQLVGQNPWMSEEPWIQEVKCIELKLRPGNALAIPTHWYYALRPIEEGATMADGSWYWITPFHTPISWLVSLVRD